MGMLMNVNVTGKECFSVTFMERGLALHSFLAERKLRGPGGDEPCPQALFQSWL